MRGGGEGVSSGVLGKYDMKKFCENLDGEAAVLPRVIRSLSALLGISEAWQPSIHSDAFSVRLPVILGLEMEDC